MEDIAQKFQKRVVKLGRDIKHLPVWQELKERIDLFKVTPRVLIFHSYPLRLRYH